MDGYKKDNIREVSPLITIITIVFNGILTIEETIKSVINQKYNNIEYIIIDGGSTDGTVDIIKKYEQYISTWISESDKGIYDGMNKGINLASGEWISFMNSGDQFYNENILSNIFNRNPDADVIYGNYISPDGEIFYPRQLDTFWKGMPFNHQASFVKTYLYKKYKFDLKYKISSVHDFFFKLYKEKLNFLYSDLIIAYYDVNGISSYSLIWLWDNFRINLKYEIFYIPIVVLRLIYIFFVRLKKILKRK